MEDPQANPTEWFNILDEINARFSNIDDGRFQKSEEEIKLHICMNLSEDLYNEIITSFKDYSSMTLSQVRREIRSFYRRLKQAEKLKIQWRIKYCNSRQVIKGKVKIKFKGASSQDGENPSKVHATIVENKDTKQFIVKRGRTTTKVIRMLERISSVIFVVKTTMQIKTAHFVKEKEAKVFVGVTHLKDSEKKIMTDNDKEDRIKESKVQRNENIDMEETKLNEFTVDKKRILKKKIYEMTHKERITMVNNILSNFGTKTLFIYEKPNPHVEKVAQSMIDNWVRKDYKVLNDEYRIFIKQRDQKIEKENWKEIKNIKKEDNKEPEQIQNYCQQRNYYDSLSDDDEINDRKSDEHVNATIHWNQLDGANSVKKSRHCHNPKNVNSFSQNQSYKSFYKRDLKTQWVKTRKQMDELVKKIESLNFNEIQYYTNQIDRICAKRNNMMRRKHYKRDNDRRLEKKF